MAEIPFYFLDELPALPPFSIIGEGFLHLVFDPVSRASFKATTSQLRRNLTPQTLFGSAVPTLATGSIVGSLYYRTPADGSAIELYQMAIPGWELRTVFSGSTTGNSGPYSSTKSYTAACGEGFSGTSVFREATRTSTISQSDADSLALGAATASAMSALICRAVAATYTATKTYTATCGTGFTGADSTRSATATSALSQSDADNKALAEATRLAISALSCVVVKASPAAPVFISYSQSNRTATVAAPSGYAISQLDYRINGGSALSVPSTGIIPIGDFAVATGSLVAYVRESSTLNKGVEAASTIAFSVLVENTTFTSTQSFTAQCGSGFTGTPITRSATRSSTFSQSDADQIALDAATQSARNSLFCTPVVQVIPQAPTIIADDVRDTILALHVFGASEILVSENDSIYTPYSGLPLQVGNTNRPEGYFKFKTKATDSRPESLIARSPAFTTAVILLPSITNFTPSFGPEGTVVTINGANFNNLTNVRLGGITASVSSSSASSISLLVPPMTTGGSIVVTTAAGSVTSSSNFAVTKRNNAAVFFGTAPSGVITDAQLLSLDKIENPGNPLQITYSTDDTRFVMMERASSGVRDRIEDESNQSILNGFTISTRNLTLPGDSIPTSYRIYAFNQPTFFDSYRIVFYPGVSLVGSQP